MRPGRDDDVLALTEQRTVIALGYFAGLSQTEIQQRTQTPLGTVKSWIRRGLISLKACLEQ